MFNPSLQQRAKVLPSVNEDNQNLVTPPVVSKIIKKGSHFVLLIKTYNKGVRKTNNSRSRKNHR